MCWATPSSCDSSPIVFNAPGSLFPAATRGSALGDPVAHDLTGAEGHDAARRNRHFDAGLGVAPDPLAFVAQDERAESGHLHIRSDRQSVAHVVQHTFDHAGRFGARQAELAMNDIGKVRARQCSVGVRVLVQPRDPEIGHYILPPWNGSAPAVSITLS